MHIRTGIHTSDERQLILPLLLTGLNNTDILVPQSEKFSYIISTY